MASACLLARGYCHQKPKSIVSLPSRLNEQFLSVWINLTLPWKQIIDVFCSSECWTLRFSYQYRKGNRTTLVIHVIHWRQCFKEFCWRLALIISKWVNIYLHSVTFPSSFYNHGHSKRLHLQLLMHITLSVGLASFVFSYENLSNQRTTFKYNKKSMNNLCKQLCWFLIHNIHSHTV